MPKHLLVANRGEIAIRILRTAADLDIQTTAVYTTDDERSLHTKHADNIQSLEQEGVAGYLNQEKLIQIATELGCDAIHPGYGFLSESAEFAQACAAADINFVGPSATALNLFGNKAKARELAEQCDVPVLPGISQAIDLQQAKDFFADLPQAGGVMLKAIAGGGGRGMRPITDIAELESAFERASSEALQAFGSGELYIEELLQHARHVEVQIIGDGSGAVSHLWDRECSLQRQRQKLVEIAPAFGLSTELREQILHAAVRLASAAKYKGVGTIEFLVAGDRFVFMEANARLQVEHTVTEEVIGFDLVAHQLKIADGTSLERIGFAARSYPHTTWVRGSSTSQSREYEPGW